MKLKWVQIGFVGAGLPFHLEEARRDYLVYPRHGGHEIWDLVAVSASTN